MTSGISLERNRVALSPSERGRKGGNALAASGWHQTPEARNIVGRGGRGKKRSLETRARMSVSAKKRCEDPEEIERLRQRRRKGGLVSRGKKLPHTPEWNKKIRDAHNTPEAREKKRKQMMGDRYDPNHRNTQPLSTRRELYELQNGRCCFCNEEMDEADLIKSRVLETHHKDGVHENNVIQNMALGHKKCHRKYHLLKKDTELEGYGFYET
jgi:hypothetical protein